jgi:hypothetical protein
MGMPAEADRTAASTQPDEITGATEANDVSAHSGLLDRQRAGSWRPAAKNPTPHPSAFIRQCDCRRGA